MNLPDSGSGLIPQAEVDATAIGDPVLGVGVPEKECAPVEVTNLDAHEFDGMCSKITCPAKRKSAISEGPELLRSAHGLTKQQPLLSERHQPGVTDSF